MAGRESFYRKQVVFTRWAPPSPSPFHPCLSFSPKDFPRCPCPFLTPIHPSAKTSRCFISLPARSCRSFPFLLPLLIPFWPIPPTGSPQPARAIKLLSSGRRSPQSESARGIPTPSTPPSFLRGFSPGLLCPETEPATLVPIRPTFFSNPQGRLFGQFLSPAPPIS